MPRKRLGSPYKCIKKMALLFISAVHFQEPRRTYLILYVMELMTTLQNIICLVKITIDQQLTMKALMRYTLYFSNVTYRCHNINFYVTWHDITRTLFSSSYNAIVYIIMNETACIGMSYLCHNTTMLHHRI